MSSVRAGRITAFAKRFLSHPWLVVSCMIALWVATQWLMTQELDRVEALEIPFMVGSVTLYTVFAVSLVVTIPAEILIALLRTPLVVYWFANVMVRIAVNFVCVPPGWERLPDKRNPTVNVAAGTAFWLVYGMVPLMDAFEPTVRTTLMKGVGTLSFLVVGLLFPYLSLRGGDLHYTEFEVYGISFEVNNWMRVPHYNLGLISLMAAWHAWRHPDQLVFITAPVHARAASRLEAQIELLDAEEDKNRLRAER